MTGDGPHTGAATIQLRRVGGSHDQLRAYKVLLDEREVAAIKQGETTYLNMTPGRHRLRLKIDWCSSPEPMIEAQEGEIRNLVCRPAGNIVAALFNVVFRRGSYIDLAPATASWDPSDSAGHWH
jgi:hypothetical protein